MTRNSRYDDSSVLAVNICLATILKCLMFSEFHQNFHSLSIANCEAVNKWIGCSHTANAKIYFFIEPFIFVCNLSIYLIKPHLCNIIFKNLWILLIAVCQFQIFKDMIDCLYTKQPLLTCVAHKN